MEIKNSLKSISVVMPTLNCRYLVEPLANEIRELCSSVSEVIIVDSQSDDGTVEFLQSVLAGLNFRVISRPRGLYASWNEGIAACREEWIYIATAGDVIGTSELEYLQEVGKNNGADVVTGMPRFVDEEGNAIEDRKWPIIELFRRRSGEETIEMSGAELVSFAVQHCHPGRRTQSWLGSSASNLYKAACLKDYPFPVSVGPSGDVLWGVHNAAKVKAVFCGSRCGRFVVHGRETTPASVESEQIIKIYFEALSEAKEWLICHFERIGLGVEERELFIQLMDQDLQLYTMVMRLRKRRGEVDYYKGYLEAVRKKIPRRLRRFAFPKFEMPR